MATSWVQVCNFALGMLGAKSIVSFSEDTKEARACARWWEQARDEVLESSYEWPAAIHRQALAQLSETPITDDFEYYYQLPVDPYCLKVLDIPDNAKAIYKIEGRRLLTSEESVTIRYIKRIIDPTEMDILLSKAIAAKIAEMIAYDITHSGAVVAAMRENYKNVLMDAIDGNIIGGENPQPTNDSWTTTGRS